MHSCPILLRVVREPTYIITLLTPHHIHPGCIAFLNGDNRDDNLCGNMLKRNVDILEINEK